VQVLLRHERYDARRYAREESSAKMLPLYGATSLPRKKKN